MKNIDASISEREIADFCNRNRDCIRDEISREFARIARKKLKTRIKKIVLFGSRARGDHCQHSDYDILLIVDFRDKKLEETILDVCVEIMNRYFTLVSTIVCDQSAWETKRHFPIGLNIVTEGVEI
jgi:uncharacterized protein